MPANSLCSAHASLPRWSGLPRLAADGKSVLPPTPLPSTNAWGGERQEGGKKGEGRGGGGRQRRRGLSEPA
eukprot:6852484-Pyramimonas_sp.AAC.1